MELSYDFQVTLDDVNMSKKQTEETGEEEENEEVGTQLHPAVLINTNMPKRIFLSLSPFTVEGLSVVLFMFMHW